MNNLLELTGKSALHYSLETDTGFGVTADSSEELWHSVDIKDSFFVDIVLSEEIFEVLLEVALGTSIVEVEMSHDNFFGGSSGTFLSSQK